MRSAKERIPRGFGKAVQTVLQESRILWRHLHGVRKARKYADHLHLNLNIGCGSLKKAGWINIDIERNADLTLDVRQPWPLPDGCAAHVYSEHFFEHIEYPVSARLFLREAWRTLEPGGQVSLGVPDTEWILRDYNSLAYGDRNAGEWLAFVKGERLHPDWCHTPLDHINHHFRQFSEHKYAYDFATLAHALYVAGFVDINRRDFDPARDSAGRAVGTLYVDARKASDSGCATIVSAAAHSTGASKP
jgi:predicted SAM-dependent methyltransferase